MAQSVVDGARLEDIASDHPGSWVRYSRGIRDLRFTLSAKAARAGFRKLVVSVKYGTAGAGKTRSVYDADGYESVFKLDRSPTGVWFDGYEGESTLLIDDFYGWIPYSMLLNILDGYPLRLPIKGGSSWACWTKVYFTCNDPPATWYKVGMTGALARRINTCTQYIDGKELNHDNLYIT